MGQLLGGHPRCGWPAGKQTTFAGAGTEGRQTPSYYIEKARDDASHRRPDHSGRDEYLCYGRADILNGCES